MFGMGLAKKLSGIGLTKKVGSSLLGGTRKAMMPGIPFRGNQGGRALSPSFAQGAGQGMMQGQGQMQNPMQSQGQMPMMQNQGIAPTPGFMDQMGMGGMGGGEGMVNPYDPRMRRNNQGGFAGPSY